MNDLHIAEWSDASIPQLLELSRATLGAGGAVAKTDEFWRWKHCENPFGRSYGIYATDEPAGAERAAAMRVLLRWQFAAPNGAHLHAVRAVDTATHPDYQRRGLFTQLTQRAIADLRGEGADLIFNTPNEKSLPGYLKMGWTLVDRRAIYVRPLRPVRMLRRQFGETSLPGDEEPEASFSPGAVLPWHAFVDFYGNEIWDLLAEWESRRTPCGWRTERSRAYYAWRFGRHPNVTYYVHAVGASTASERRLQGFCVVRANVRNGWQEIVLCEMALRDASAAGARSLVRSLLSHARADYVAAHFASGSIEHRALRRAGFLPAMGQGMRFTVLPLDVATTGAPDVRDAGAWDLTLGDLEVF